MTSILAGAPIPLDVPSARGVRKLILARRKNGDAYLLDRDNLGGIGAELVSAHVTPSRAIASPAVWSAGDSVFVALEVDDAKCPLNPSAKGLLVLRIRADPAPMISTAWCHKVVSHLGGPIVTTSDRLGLGSHGRESALRIEGRHRRASPPQPLLASTNFQTLIGPDGRLFVKGGRKVYAFTF
jgi:hypothetical protein